MTDAQQRRIMLRVRALIREGGGTPDALAWRSYVLATTIAPAITIGELHAILAEAREPAPPVGARRRRRPALAPPPAADE